MVKVFVIDFINKPELLEMPKELKPKEVQKELIKTGKVAWLVTYYNN